MIDERPAPPPLGSPGNMLPKNLDARHHVPAPARPAGEEVADDLLGVAVAVEIGCVDEVPAAIQVGRQDLLRLLDAAPRRLPGPRRRSWRESKAD